MDRDIGDCKGFGPNDEGPEPQDPQCSGNSFRSECEDRDECASQFEDNQAQLREQAARAHERARLRVVQETPRYGQLGLGTDDTRRAGTSQATGSAQNPRMFEHTRHDTWSDLAVDEPPPAEGEWGQYIAAVVARTVFKAFCLSLAHVANNLPFRRPKGGSPP